ncbi:MAG: Ser-Thr-rich GPI-anchored membrane family protein [Candidatus Paceibacterota bacterium]|jgi:hypothetical protein
MNKRYFLVALCLFVAFSCMGLALAADNQPAKTGLFQSIINLFTNGGKATISDTMPVINTKKITIISPASNSKWIVGNTYSIEWVAQEDVGKIRISLSQKGGSDVTEIIAEEIDASLGKYSWTVPTNNKDINLGGQFELHVVAVNSSTIVDTKDLTIEVAFSCTDSDEGKNYLVSGTTKWGPLDGQYQQSTDACDVAGKTLSERYCYYSENLKGSYSGVEYFTCPNGCKDGACIEKQVTTKDYSRFSVTELVEDNLPESITFWTSALCPTASRFAYAIPEGYTVASCESGPTGSHGGCSFCAMSKIKLGMSTVNNCSYIYSNWSTCQDGTRTREVIAAVPDRCIEGNPVLKESCEIIPSDCVKEGSSIPVTSLGFTQSCCSGLTLCPVSAGTVGIRGICKKSCATTPSITILSPKQDETVLPGSTYTIKWKGENLKGDTIYIHGNKSSLIATLPASATSYVWTVPQEYAGSKATIWVESLVSGQSVWEAYSNSYFNVGKTSSTEASVTLLSPNGGEKFKWGNVYDISWKFLGVEKVNISLVSKETETDLLVATLAENVLASSGKFSWKVGERKINMVDFYKIVISDSSSGNIVDKSDNYFSIVVSSSTKDYSKFSVTELVEDNLPESITFWTTAYCPSSASFPYIVPEGYKSVSCEAGAVGSHGGCSFCAMSKIKLVKSSSSVITKPISEITKPSTPIGLSPEKPLNQMNREELINFLIKLIQVLLNDNASIPVSVQPITNTITDTNTNYQEDIIPNDGNTYVYFKTPGSSSWTVPEGVTSVDAFILGGGGGGGDLGCGGGGGYTKNLFNYSVVSGQSISINVGAGGLNKQGPYGYYSGDGESSSFGSILAMGGVGCKLNDNVYTYGDGGSGGGGSIGGSDGSDGIGTKSGKGQGSSTRPFLDSYFNSLGAGGGGNTSPATGGAYGGGNGCAKDYCSGEDGTPNTGGGGGSMWGYGQHAGAGGSGMVIVRYKSFSAQ